MRNRQKAFWIPLAGSITLLLLVVLAILSSSSTLSLADAAPQSPAAVEGVDSWTWRGPSYNTAAGLVPMVKSLIIDPASPYTVYVGTNQGVYRSTNAGATWQPGNGGLGGYGDLVVSAIDIDLSNHQRLVIGTWGYGLFQSVDGGLNWSRLADPADYADPQPSAVPDPAALDPDAPQVRAGGPSDIDPTAASELSKQSLLQGGLPSLHRPVAERQIESPQGLPATLSWTPVRDVAIHPSNPSQIFACVDNGYGLFVSNNSGGSWTRVSGVPVNSCRTITFAPSNNLVRYASFGSWTTTAGFYRTINGGVSWVDVGAGEIDGTVTAVAIHPTNSNIVLAATSDYGLYRSSNGGDSWTNVSTPSSLPDLDFYSVAFAPNNPDVAYAGGLYWVYRSGDAGDTWTNADPAYPTFYVQGLAIHPTSPSTVLVGNNWFPVGGVYRRTSDGSAFALAASGMSDTFVLDIEQDPNNASILYAATWGGGVFLSENGGLTWTQKGPIPYIYALDATQGLTGTVLYAATFYTDYGVLRTRTNGDTWTEVSRGWDSDISFDIKSLDGGAQNLIAATANGVELSTDGGATWPQASGLDQGLVLKLAQSPLDPNDWLAATYGGGVWSSGNGGISWGETSAGLGSQYVYDVAYSAPPHNTAYAATLGVSRSDNGGVSWYPSGLSGTYVRALDTLGGPGYDVFAGTHNKGVYMAPERANWWFDLNAGLGEDRIRTLFARDYDTLFAGTNGLGAWEYTIATRPRPQINLPLVLGNYGVAGGFDSQFNGSAEGWVSHTGSWYVGTDVLWTNGLAGTSSSISYDEVFGNFEYEARVGRLGCETCANRLYVRGAPNPLTGSNDWYNGYVFQYIRVGYYLVYKEVGGSPILLQDWTESPAINQGSSFNNLKVIASGPNLYFYINDILVWTGTDYSLSSGRVGLGMYRDPDSSDNQFQADWARLTTLASDTVIDDVVSAEQQALNDTATQWPGGNEHQAPPEIGGTAVPMQVPQIWPLQEQTEPQGLLGPSD